jgi:Na+/citrate or Na+/malate symporter
MKFFEKTSEHKTWDDRHSFIQNITGGAAIGSLLSGASAKIQTSLINKKLKAVKQIAKIRPNILRMSILGGLGGAVLGLGKHFYEQEHYTK